MTGRTAFRGLTWAGSTLARRAARRTTRRVRYLATRRVRGWRRELERPWREGRKGTPAEVGRWIGLGLAVGAFVAGVGAAVYADWPRD